MDPQVCAAISGTGIRHRDIYDDMGERKLVSLPAFSYMIDQHHNLWEWIADSFK